VLPKVYEKKFTKKSLRKKVYEKKFTKKSLRKKVYEKIVSLQNVLINI
jgi:hypothetical protein